VMNILYTIVDSVCVQRIDLDFLLDLGRAVKRWVDCVLLMGAHPRYCSLSVIFRAITGWLF
jgi:hypothetical protein